MDMLQTGAPPEHLGRPLLRALAAQLGGLAGEARQDGLDFLAVIAGLKRTCLVGRGYCDESFAALLRRLAATASLPVVTGTPWEPLPEPDFLPDWYLAASARRRARQQVIYICADESVRREVAAASAKGRISPREEAALLSYPLCCVAEQHRRTLAIERLCAESAGADLERGARLVAAGIEPRPLDRARLAELVAIAPAPCTSVNLCAACAADAKSPAAALSRRYRALARAAGIEA